MIAVIINKVNYSIPTTWSEVTYFKWQQVQTEKNPLKILSIITSIPLELLENFNQKQINKVELILNFIRTPINLKELGKPINPIDIKRQSWGKRIELEQLLRSKSDDINGVVNCYQLDVNLPIIEVFEQVMDIMNQFKDMIERENKELSITPTREQILAGCSMYDEFGVMNTIRSVALGNILNFDRVLEIEYNVVFLYLKMSRTDSIYQSNYQKVLSKK